MKRCVRCGYENNDGAEHCLNCGNILDDDSESKTRANAFKGIILSSRLLKTILVTLVISVLAIVFFSFQLALFGFNQTIYFADVVMIVFFSVVAAICIALMIVRIVLKVKKNKK